MGEVDEVIRIESDELDVKKIMEDIQRRVDSYPRATQYQELSSEELEELGIPEGEFYEDPLHELSAVIQLARTFSEVTGEYSVATRKPLIGPLVVLVKKVLRRFMRVYMDAVFVQQREFNRKILDAMERLHELILRERSMLNPGRLDRAAFFERWGEDFEEVVSRMEAIVELFPPDKEIINLFSGRGEFLKACGGKGRRAKGVEGDERLVAACQTRSLPVMNLDELVFLEKTLTSSLEAIFIYELGERMGPLQLRYVVSLLGEKMAPGGLLILLNHFPTSLFGGEAAYRDPTILRLIHPQALVFMLEEMGFASVQWRHFESGEESKDKEIEDLLQMAERMERERPDLGTALRELVAPSFYLVQARR